MGIRFFCANGHKIHVKEFLAGKRGICPECGVKVDIPDKPGGRKQTKSAVSGANDARAESPGDRWFVRIASGEQFGPASRTVLSTWIREGRVTEDCLVWCESWDQWKPAAEVLPATREAPAAAASVPPSESPIRESPQAPSVPQIETEPGMLPSRRTTQRHSQKLVFILVAACLLLLVPLIYVVTVKM